MACHDLCRLKEPPKNYKALLGLGLNFCPRPRFTTFQIEETCERFRLDLYTKMFMADKPDNDVPKLFKRSNWQPPLHMIPYSLIWRIDSFTKEMKRMFRKKRSRSNMLPHQLRLLSELTASKEFVVIQADKNLGPCILERNYYIERAFNDHLLDTTTYRQLTEYEARVEMTMIKKFLNNFMMRNKKFLPKSEVKFLKRTVEVDDPYPKFYLLAKIHKTPWKTRQIISVSGSQLHGLGKWVDRHLQPVAKKTESFISSSYQLKTHLLTIPPLPPNARLFTADAVSMYTNIDTKHALKEIGDYLSVHREQCLVPPFIIKQALALIMNHMIFQFGDTYWHQLTGTAMGTPPAPMYATIYFAIHEATIISEFPEISTLYKRYIDDVLGVWIPDPTQNDNQRWLEFQERMNTFGKLRWEFSTRSREAVFLDLTISIGDNQKLQTELYEKGLNLYLYLPPHSTHPKGVLKGLVFGSILRIYRLNSQPETCKAHTEKLYYRLRARGYKAKDLQEIFSRAILRAKEGEKRIESSDIDEKPPVFFHLPFHPMDPASNEIQKLFHHNVLAPPYKPLLPTLLNHNKSPLGTNRLIVAYHKQPNLGNLMSPRVLRATDGPPVSAFLSDETARAVTHTTQPGV
jgi:hypothetical protein